MDADVITDPIEITMKQHLTTIIADFRSGHWLFQRPSFQRKLLALTLSALTMALPMNRAWAAEAAESQKQPPLAREVFKVDGRSGFVMLPASANLHPNRPIPWVWYAPALPNLPDEHETWMFEKFLSAGIAVAGVDVGESHGSPQGRAQFTAFYQELTG